jgi:hypothetical protein
MGKEVRDTHAFKQGFLRAEGVSEEVKGVCELEE